MCTALIYKDAKGNAYIGRTHEQPELYVEQMKYFPTGSKIESLTPAGKPGATFNTRYAFLAITIKDLIPNTKQDMLLQGQNDQGVSFTCNVLVNTSSANTAAEDAKVLSVSDLGHWALGNFQNLAQVKQASSPKEAILTLSHVMNNFDRFSNFSVDMADQPKSGEVSSSSEVTLITFLHDLAQNHFYIRTIDAMNFTMLDISKLAVLDGPKVLQLDAINALDGGDGTHMLLH